MKLNTQDLVKDAVTEIEKYAPKHSHVEIDVKEEPAGIYSTHIRLETKQKVYFAKKEDMFMYRSFSRALRAIKAQLKKKKVHNHSIAQADYL